MTAASEAARVATGRVGVRSSAPSGRRTVPARTRIAALARLERGDVRRSRWLVFSVALYAALALLFLAIGLRESGVVGFTGISRVLASLSHAFVILLPLLALAGTGLSVNRARESGTLELLLGQPVSRDDYFLAVTLVRFGSLLAPLLLLMPALALVGRFALGQPVPWEFLGRATAVSTALLWAFTGIGLAIATMVKESARAVAYLLAVWALSVGLLDFALIGLMLEWRLPPQTVFTIAALNPVEAARLALLAGADTSLESLGPVGVFVVRRVGDVWLLVAGVGWPVLVGTVAWVIARRSFRQGEAV